MKDWQTRLLEEHAEIDTRLARLDAFIMGQQFQGLLTEDQDLLRAQSEAMTAYAEILRKRVYRLPV